MHDALRHRGADGGTWTEGATGLAAQLNRVTPESFQETQPARDAAGATLVFDGRLDNRADLLTLTGLPPAVPDSRLVLAAYRCAGGGFVRHLNGDFALALFDPRGPELLLARDALGVRPLYHARVGDTILFASEIKPILATGLVAARPNEDLFAAFLLGRSHLMADRGETFFAGVSSVPPGHQVRISPAGTTIGPHWEFDLSRGERRATFDEYVVEFRALFRQAVARRLRSAHPVAVTVSGGLDSSAVFCFAHELIQGGAVTGRLAGLSSAGAAGSPADESSYVDAIERGLDVVIPRFAGPTPSATAGAVEQVRRVESPVLDSQWNVTDAFLRHVRGMDARVLLTGHWGDQMLFDQSYLVDLVRAGHPRLAWRHVREFPRWFTDSAPWEFQRRALADLAREWIPGLWRAARHWRAATPGQASWYPGFAGRALPTPVPAWSHRAIPAHTRAIAREATNKYHTLCLEWNNKVGAAANVEMVFPFLDRDLVAFMMAVPGEIAAHDGVPKALLRAAARGVMPDVTVHRRWKADFSTLVNEGTRDDLANVARLLGAGSRAARRGYVASDAVARELANANRALAGGACEFSWALRDLLGLETWLQVFWSDDPSHGG